jgi:hypothetical protein
MKINLMIVFWFFVLPQTFFMQTLSNEEKNKIINALSITSMDSMHTQNYAPTAIELVMEYKIVEAIPNILSNIWKQDPFTRIRFLNALHRLSSSETEAVALSMIDSLNISGFKNEIFSQLEMKILVIKILFELKNYSYYQIVFDRINEDKQDISALMLLGDIIKNVPNQEEKAKSLLLDSSINLQENYKRWYLISLLNEIYGQELLSFYINRFKVEHDLVNKNLILINILSDYQNTEVRSTLVEGLINETDPVVIFNICDRLLNNYNNPNSHKIVGEYLTNNQNFKFKYLLNALLYSKPKFNETSSSVFAIIDSVSSFTLQSYKNNWLRDLAYKEFLLEKLQRAFNYLLSMDSVKCSMELKKYQYSVQQVYSDSAGSYPKYVSKDAYKFLYYYPKYILERLPSPPIVKLEDSQGKLLRGGNLLYYEGGWKNAINNNDGTFMIDTKLKTISLRMTYEYGSQTKNNVTVGRDTIVFQTKNVQVKILDSKGAILDTGKVQYYAGAWREFGTTINGVVSKELLPNNYSFRMTYAYASNDKQQNIGTNPIVIFQTVNAAVQLKNSLGNFIDQGTIQYYSGAWREFGTTTNGVAAKELLPNNYSFRTTYAYASNDKQQNIGTNPIVIFQTVNAAVQLKNSLGNLIDVGTVQYYSGAWREFGTTINGVVSKELLPNNYSFRMTYAYASNDKQQNIGTNPIVIFQTVNTTVQLKNSLGNLIDVGTVQYYSGAWREFGTTINGVVSKELLPNNYSFRMTYAYASNDKQQNIGTNPIVIFQTVNTTVQLKNSLGNFIDQGTIQYYSGAWREFGTTSRGIASLELLPNNYSFRITNEFISVDKTQNTGTNNIVTFQTVQCTVKVTDAENLPVNNAAVSYYSGTWRGFGATINGTVTKELLPASLTFRAIFGSKQTDKTQNISTNNIVDIKLP